MNASDQANAVTVEREMAETAQGAGALPLSLGSAKHDASIKYRPDIDGLRAVAVLSVIGFHAFPEWMPGGFVGVDVFFIISGYLISSIIFEQVRDGRFSIATFYARRIKRIFPSLIVILLFCLALGWYVLFPHEYEALGKHIAAGAGFISNFVLWRESGYFDAAAETKPLLHLWSLGIEEQFYFFWPAAVYVAWKKKINLFGVLLVLAGTSFALNLFFLSSKAVATFYLPFTRVWELLIGGAIAYASHRGLKFSEGMGSSRNWSSRYSKNIQSFVGCGLILVSLFVLNRYFPFPGWWALLPCVGASLVISAGPHAWVNRNLLSRPVMVWFGLISFPLYLWHWPLLAFANVIEPSKPTVEMRALMALASVVLAWLTYQLVEKKLRFRAAAEKPLFISCAIVLLIGLAAWQGLLEPRHNTRQVRLVTEAIADWHYPPPSFSSVEHGGVRFYTGKGLPGGSVIFIGDSDVGQYGARIEHLLSTEPQATKSVIFATTGGCPPIPGVMLDRTKECQPRFSAAVKLAKTSDVESIVIGACWYCYLYKDKENTSAGEYYVVQNGVKHYLNTDKGMSLAVDSFAEFLKSITSVKKVYVVLSSPVGDGINPRELLTGSRFGDLSYKSSAGIPLSEFQKKFGVMNERLRRLAIEAGAIVIDPLPSLCAEGVCSALTPAGVPIYADGVHIRSSYVREFATFVDLAVKAGPPQ